MAAGIDVKVDSVAVVLRGRFNPAIPTPVWLLNQDLISSEDADGVEIEFIVPQACVYRLPWARIEVTEDRFTAQTSEPDNFERLRDLVVGTFGILSHTPLAALGINRSFHVEVGGEERWHSVGDGLVPKQPWEDSLSLPGMASVQVHGARNDAFGGRRICRVEPSAQVQFGIFFEQNDHYTLEVDVAPPSTRTEFALMQVGGVEPPSVEKLPTARAILSQNWTRSLSTAEKAMKTVLSGVV